MKTIYEAFDGTKFNDQQECYMYELNHKDQRIKQLKDQLDTKMNITPQVGAKDIWIKFSGYDDDVYAVRIDNEEDLRLLNEWGKLNFDTFNQYTREDIGTIQIFTRYDSDTWQHGTPEDLKKEFCEAIDDLCNKLLKHPTVIDGEIQYVYRKHFSEEFSEADYKKLKSGDSTPLYALGLLTEASEDPDEIEESFELFEEEIQA